MSCAAGATPSTAVTGPWRIEVDRVSYEYEFEQFFLANYDSVLHALTVATGDRERATDATQEAFIKAYSKWSKIRQYDSPTAWVRRIAVNATRDSIRSERRRRRREQANRPDAVASPADGYVADSSARDLLAGLTRRQREVATLFYVDDRSIGDIAYILRLNEGTVKFHLSEARHRLRQLVEHDEART